MDGIRVPGGGNVSSRHYSVVCDTSDKDEWLRHRSLGIGASEIAAVLGVSAWKSRLCLYYDKIDPPAPEADGEWLRWGQLLEDAILDELSIRSGSALHSRGLLLQSTRYPWALATPDAITDRGEPIEAKNLAWGYVASEWEEQIPEKYLLQCQQQMLVTGERRCLFGALLHGQRLVWEWVPRDEDRIRRIIVSGAEFWRRVEQRDPPPSDGHALDRARLAGVAGEGDLVELANDAELDGLIHEYESCKQQRVSLEKSANACGKREDAAANQIAQRLGDARGGFTTHGYTFAWKSTPRRGYTVEPTVIRKFRITPPRD